MSTSHDHSHLVATLHDHFHLAWPFPPCIHFVWPFPPHMSIPTSHEWLMESPPPWKVILHDHSHLAWPFPPDIYFMGPFSSCIGIFTLCEHPHLTSISHAPLHANLISFTFPKKSWSNPNSINKESLTSHQKFQKPFVPLIKLKQKFPGFPPDKILDLLGRVTPFLPSLIQSSRVTDFVLFLWHPLFPIRWQLPLIFQMVKLNLELNEDRGVRDLVNYYFKREADRYW